MGKDRYVYGNVINAEAPGFIPEAVLSKQKVPFTEEKKKGKTENTPRLCLQVLNGEGCQH